MADVVAPISYAPKGQQYAHELAAYKWRGSSAQTRTRLLAVLLVFLSDHRGCLTRAARAAPPSVMAVVPSTRGRLGPHPLRALIGDRLALPWAPLVPGGNPDSEGRIFLPDRFALDRRAGPDVRGRTVLLLEDTWATGSRVQSASHTLKAAGADRVIAVVLGRHANPNWNAWTPVLQEIRERPFRQDDCAYHAH